MAKLFNKSIFNEDSEKKALRRSRNFKFRLNMFFLVTFALFTVLIFQLANLQFVQGEKYKAQEIKIEYNQVLIAPIRGNILDNKGKLLAYSTSTQSLYYKFPSYKDKDIEAARQLVGELYVILNQPDSEPIQRATIKKNMDLEFSQNNWSVPRRVKSGLSQGEIAYFLENKDKYPDFEIVEESIRHYDPDSVAVQLVGYLKKFKLGAKMPAIYPTTKDEINSMDNETRVLQDEIVGFDGIELMYQEQLRGVNGIKVYHSTNGQAEVPMVTPPQKGNDVTLTINKDVQLATEQAIMDQLDILHTTPNMKRRQPLARTGYAVAMEVETGAVVAMASMPDYDPALWEGGSINWDDYKQIENYMLNGTIQSIWGPYSESEKNIRTSSLVPLGSVMKPLTVLVGLSEGLITTNTMYRDTGFFYYGRDNKSRISNSQFLANGVIDPAKALEKSSNTFMTEMIANKLYMRSGDEGVTIWDNYLKEFGLGEGSTTESGLPNEQPGIINYFAEMETNSSQSALIQASFGQQARYTTLQLAAYITTLANRGERMKPQFMSKITDQDGNIVDQLEPVMLNKVEFPDSYWNEIETGMSKVQVSGFEGFPYAFNRKTGTSQQQVGGRLIDNSVFLSYAPADKPKLAIAVVVPYGGFGANTAAPIGRKIFDAYDKAIGLTSKAE